MAKYNILTHKKVDKLLQANNEIAQRFIQKLSIIEIDPFDKSLDVKKLENTSQKYRLRIGKYRFFFTIIQDKIIIYFFDADSRWDSYKSKLSK